MNGTVASHVTTPSNFLVGAAVPPGLKRAINDCFHQ